MEKLVKYNLEIIIFLVDPPRKDLCRTFLLFIVFLCRNYLTSLCYASSIGTEKSGYLESIAFSMDCKILLVSSSNKNSCPGLFVVIYYVVRK